MSENKVDQLVEKAKEFSIYDALFGEAEKGVSLDRALQVIEDIKNHRLFPRASMADLAKMTLPYSDKWWAALKRHSELQYKITRHNYAIAGAGSCQICSGVPAYIYKVSERQLVKCCEPCCAIQFRAVNPE